MKKQTISVTLFMIVILLFTACSSDDDSQPTTEPVDPPVSGNEAPVVTAQTFTVSEDIDDDATIGTVSATDVEDDPLTFTLIQNSDDLFELTEKGELSLISGKNLDFEKVTSHEVTIEVSDGTNKVSVAITITVENVVEPFITTWETITANELITIAISSILSEKYDYTIDWGDGSVENIKTMSGNHEYVTPGIYTVSISGVFPAIRMEELDESSDVFKKLQSIEQWGEIEWESFNDAFVRCENLVYNAKDTPNLSKVTDISGIFAGCKKFNPASLNSWDVSGIEQMQFAFADATFFNGDITQWDVSNVFDMTGMFRNASSFNGDISQWNVSKVRNMSTMFQSASNFNRDLNNWDVTSVTNMRSMFNRALEFNGDVSAWDVSKVGDMLGMFERARSFNGNLSQWDVSDVGNMNFMLDETNMSTENYDKLLISWATLNLKSSVIFGVQGLTYCDAETARATIIRDHKWIFRGDREECLGL